MYEDFEIRIVNFENFTKAESFDELRESSNDLNLINARYANKHVLGTLPAWAHT